MVNPLLSEMDLSVSGLALALLYVFFYSLPYCFYIFDWLFSYGINKLIILVYSTVYKFISTSHTILISFIDHYTIDTYPHSTGI